MQIVIDISEESYKYIKIGYVTSDLIRAIKESIVLPKGHGRLIDADALNRKDVNCANVPMNFIDTAQTIVEADK